MKPVEIILDPLNSDPDGIAKAQQSINATNLTLNGVLVSRLDGFARLNNVAQVVEISSLGDLSTVNFTLFGRDEDGRASSESIVGPNAGTVTTAGLFTTITKIISDSGITSDVEVGITSTSAPFTSGPIMLNIRALNKGTKITQTVLLGSGTTATYTVQFTTSNIQDITIIPIWSDTDNVNLIAQTTTNTGNVFFPIISTRLSVSAHTGNEITFINIQDS